MDTGAREIIIEGQLGNVKKLDYVEIQFGIIMNSVIHQIR